MLMTRLRREAMTWGPAPVRTWEWSSAKVTSRTQCRLFSICLWPRIQAASHYQRQEAASAQT
jgi:hypothetical protein